MSKKNNMDISLNITERSVENIQQMKKSIVEVIGICESLGYDGNVAVEAIRSLGIAAKTGDKIRLNNCSFERLETDEN